MEKATELFLKYQQVAEERFLKWEEERWRRESELEDRRRREDQEHELRMCVMTVYLVSSLCRHYLRMRIAISIITVQFALIKMTVSC